MEMLTRQKILSVLRALIYQWQKNPPFIYPAFYVELDFAAFLSEYMVIGVRGKDLYAVSVNLAAALADAISCICRTMDKYSVDGAAIWCLMDKGRIITRKDLRAYNRQVRACTGERGISIDEWEGYHQWLLASACWDGFIASFENDFTVRLKEDWIVEVDLLLQPGLRPLFAMKAALEEIGSPCISRRNENYGDCISLNSNWSNYLLKGYNTDS